MPLSRPAPLADIHELNDFSSGVTSLDDWLKRRARSNQVSGASRTYVVSEGPRVVGYYALASGGLAIADSVGRFRRNMPDPIPVVCSVAWQWTVRSRATASAADFFEIVRCASRRQPTRSESGGSSFRLSPNRQRDSIRPLASIRRRRTRWR